MTTLDEEIMEEADRLGKRFDWTAEERDAVVELARRVAAATTGPVIIL